METKGILARKRKSTESLLAIHRVLEYLPVLFLCAFAWMVSELTEMECATDIAGGNTNAFLENVKSVFCYIISPNSVAWVFGIMIVVVSIPISYRSWDRWSRYRLSRKHPFFNNLVSITAIACDYIACFVLFFGQSLFGDARYIAIAALVSFSLFLLIYSEIVSNDNFAVSQIWKDPDIYSLLIILASVWTSFAALTAT